MKPINDLWQWFRRFPWARKKRLNFSKFNWGNGQPAIEINPYSNTARFFNSILDRLGLHFNFPHPKDKVIGISAIPELDNHWAETEIEGEKVIVAMDDLTCSIACETEELRDRIYAALASQDYA